MFEVNKKIYEAKWGEWVPHHFRKFEQVQSTEHLAPVVFDGQHYVEGQCVTCGENTHFYYTDEALWRVSLNCEHSRITSRCRSIVRGILFDG